MEKQPHQRRNGEGGPEVNSYGTDDPARQAEIERARSEASAERKRNRAVLENLVTRGVPADEAEAIIEYVDSLGGQLVLDLSEAGDQSQLKPERERRYRPQVYAVDLDSGERGIQHGLWIDADQEPEAITTDIVAMLASSPTVGASNWKIGASQSFAGIDLAGCTEVSLISKLGRGVREHGAAYAVWIAMVGKNGFDELDKFSDFYVGSYDSPEAWARAVGEDLEWEAHLDEVVQPQLRSYVEVNYVKFARDAMQQWDTAIGHDRRFHVFLR